ncbi:MAG: response regulator transcription factor [Nitrospina sp.]|nr:response regulator transcription factor [Nitrospina sp.]
MKKSSVLIVDDEESIRVSLEGFLKKKYYVQTAESGSIALEMLQDNQYDLILSDIKMDDMNGIVLLKKVKENFPESAFLLMTGFSSLNTAIEALRLGASDYLIKPCVKKIVFESIARCLKNNSKKNTEELTQKFQEKLNTLPGVKSLTKRELEVFNYLFSGMSDKDMAEKLAVSLPTIKFHLQNIYKKSGINGRKGLLQIISSTKVR